MLLKLIIFFLLFPSVLMAQNIKPLIVTDNASNTCNTARMIFSPGSVSCSGSNATVIGGGGSGTVTAISVASTNGFTGTSSGGATPALTLATSVTGPIKGNGTAISAAASTDIIGLFSTCSGTQYLGADGACHTAGGGSSQWTTTNTNDVYLPSSGNVGIGTNLTTTAALTVMNGNVGIGTWVPAYALDLVNNKSRSRSVFRVVTTTQSATPTINTDTGDIFEITGLAQAITSMTTNLSGTPLDGDQLEIIFTDNGTARALTFGTSFESTTVTLPTTTVISTPLKVFFQWNATASKWDCVGIS